MNNQQQLQEHQERVQIAIAAISNPVLLEPIKAAVSQFHKAAATIDTTTVVKTLQAIAPKRDSTQP